jgi:hypothetical protein
MFGQSIEQSRIQIVLPAFDLPAQRGIALQYLLETQPGTTVQGTKYILGG